MFFIDVESKKTSRSSVQDVVASRSVVADCNFQKIPHPTLPYSGGKKAPL